MSEARGQLHNRDAFIANIARRLGRTAPLTAPPADYPRGIPEHAKRQELTPQEKIELFTDNFTALTGKVWVVPRTKAGEQVPRILREVVAELRIERVAVWDHEELNALGLKAKLKQDGVRVVPWIAFDEAAPAAASGVSLAREAPVAPGGEGPAPHSNWAKRPPLLRETERCQLGIVWPDFAVANTGTLMLLGGEGRGRSVSLLPGSLLGIFRAEQLVARMGEAFRSIRESAAASRLAQAGSPGASRDAAGGSLGASRESAAGAPNASRDAAAGSDGMLPSSVTMITGPSRSADIENDLTIGIHGPGKVFAVILV